MLKRLQQIPRIQWVAWRTVPVTGAGAVQGRWYTIPVAIWWHVLPIPVHVGDRQALKHTDSGAKQGQKGSVMHRFRGYRGESGCQGNPNTATVSQAPGLHVAHSK